MVFYKTLPYNSEISAQNLNKWHHRFGRECGMKPKINPDECIGDGICEEICPEVFELRDDGLAYVIEEEPDDSLFDKVEEAVEECPTSAITIED